MRGGFAPATFPGFKIGLERLTSRLRDWIAAGAGERSRMILWLPVMLGTGVAFYFLLDVEPALWPALLVLLGASLAAFFLRARPWAFAGALALASMALGFAAAKWHGDQAAAPVLQRELGPLAFDGRVVDIEPYRRTYRLVLDRLQWSRDLPDVHIQRVRVTVPGARQIKIGDRVRVTATLLPPPGPAAPGAYDFQRDAWFNRLGAVGFAFAAPHIVSQNSEGSLAQSIGRLRSAVTARLLGDRRDDRGGMAAALMTGEQNAISEPTMQAMRDSGLAHLLSISGLHIAMVAALLMGALRFGLALIPALALRHPIKKWAASLALLGTLFYLLLAGAPVPAQRSFLMAAIVLLAILIDRNAISLRTVACAAAVVLLVAPVSMLGPSFQMSFAAVVALIAAWDATRAWRRRRSAASLQGGNSWLRAIVLYVLGVAATSLIASLATAPFALYHFNRMAWFGILANLLAVPITGFWIMPFGLLALLLMPFGLERWPLAAMGWGIDLVIDIANWIAALPGAATLLPSMPIGALIAIAVGMLWLCLWSMPWRWLGGLPIAGAALIAALSVPPDILVSGDGRLFAIRADDGTMLIAPPGSRMVNDTWTRRSGQGGVAFLPQRGRSEDGSIACDRNGCILRRGRHNVSLVRNEDAAVEDCRSASLVVAAVPVSRQCRAQVQAIDLFDLRRNGSHAIWLDRDGVRVLTDRQWRGDRPWVPKPPWRGPREH